MTKFDIEALAARLDGINTAEANLKPGFKLGNFQSWGCFLNPEARERDTTPLWAVPVTSEAWEQQAQEYLQSPEHQAVLDVQRAWVTGKPAPTTSPTTPAPRRTTIER